MKRIVDIYIESISGSGDYSKLELFNDEKIEITSTIQNIQDISKVYTDFTQSFTVPASPHNNSVLHHFYESDVDIEQTTGTDPKNKWNFNFRIRAKVEIDLVPFRDGTIMMEKANIKNGRPDSYTLTFYGDLVSLKDKFGNSKLSDLDLIPYNTSYSASEVINKVTSSTQQNIMYPLIGSKRYWTYNDNTSTDIKTSAGAVVFNELFPAIKVSLLFDLIQSKFGLTFNSSFFTSSNEKWDKMYLWLKNEETYTALTSGDFADLTYPSGTPQVPSFSTSLTSYPAKNGFNYNLSTGVITCQNLEPIGGGVVGVQAAKLLISVSNLSSTSVEYYIDLYKDGKVIKTYAKTGAVSNILLYTFWASDNGSGFYIIVRSATPLSMTLGAVINYPNYNNFKQSVTFSTITTTASLDIASKIPDITVADFFSGILKMFNATCYATDTNVFTVEPLDLWYNKGTIYDITEYTDTDSIDVERPSVYKKLSFKYQKSESFMNRRYYDTNIVDREYSDTSITLSNEGTELTIEVPFESLLMDNLNADDFQVGFCLTKAPDYKPYIPKPVLLYYNGRINDTLYLNNGVTSTSYTDFNIFSNALDINGVKYSLTWHPENDVKSPNLPLENNLYSLYYNSYLQNLFNPKCRLVRVKAHFPLSLLTNLRLNDRLIIRDKRYIINDLKSDITSGEVSLSLINDFRPMVNDSSIETILVSSGGGTVDMPWKVPNGAVDTTFTSPVSGVTFSPGTTTTSTTVGVTVPANTNTPTPIWTESTTDNIITDDGYGIVNEQGSGAVIPIEATNTNFNGLTTVYTFNLFQE